MDAARYIAWLAVHWHLVVYAALAFLLVCGLLLLGRKLYIWHVLLHREMTWLELTPPSHTSQSALATKELFNVIHGFHGSRSLIDKLLGHQVSISFEITSRRKSGIRYLIQVERRHADSIRRTIAAYLPTIKVIETIPLDKVSNLKIIEFKQSSHYAFPLATPESFEANDPISYLTNAMANLEPSESIHLQLVVSPVRINEALLLARRILSNEDLLRKLSSKRLPLWDKLVDVIDRTFRGGVDLVGETIVGSSHSKSYSRSNYLAVERNKSEKPVRSISTFELEVMQTMHEKLNQPLFRVNLRAAVRMNAKAATAERIKSIKTSLHALAVPSYQGLKQRTILPRFNFIVGRHFRLGMPSFFKRHSVVLSSAELASLYHFPVMATQTDNLITSLSRTLAAPISLKQGTNLDVIIGMNNHHDVQTPIGLTSAERERHMYIIGGTGNGKTTMLQYAIIQDIQAGKGVAIVDPHGDMAETILAHIPRDRIKDVVYFNPDDLDHPFAMNLLELTPGLAGNEFFREKDIITESVISIFRKIFSDDDSGGHRIEYVLRNAIHTALTVENATIFTVLKLLQNPTYRKQVSSKLTDENLQDFWKNELGKAGNMQKVKMSAGITAKIGRFNVNASAKAILSQPNSSIDFQEIIDSGKILICNFSKGMLGEDVSELFGITVLAKLQLASLRRARVKQSERRPYYLYVDEFQNFATPSFVQMLSESRKYKLFLTMAEQSTSQQKDQQMVQVILANVGTVICFRTGNPRDEQLLLPLFRPFIEEGEIANLDAYTFFARLSSVKAQEPVSGKTLLITEPDNSETAELAVATSRMLYSKKDEKTLEVSKRTRKSHENQKVKPVIERVVVPPGG